MSVVTVVDSAVAGSIHCSPATARPSAAKIDDAGGTEIGTINMTDAGVSVEFWRAEDEGEVETRMPVGVARTSWRVGSSEVRGRLEDGKGIENDARRA